jgi:outer membrane protein X
MKNFFKVAIAAVALTMVAYTANAQQKGDMAAGAKIGFATSSGYSHLGIGAKFQYNVMDPLRLEGSFTYFLPKEMAGGFASAKTSLWDASVNAHWLFRVGNGINVYPLAGLGIFGTKADVDLDLGEWGDYGASASASTFVLNLGGGADFFLSDSMFLNAEAKYLVANGGFLVLSAGVGFMF